MYRSRSPKRVKLGFQADGKNNFLPVIDKISTEIMGIFNVLFGELLK
jgi:hypothetical protein